MRSLHIVLSCFVAFSLSAEICTYSLKEDEMQRSKWPSELADINRANNVPPDVFIVTMPRSGSTFLGEMFKRNSDYVYLFEPTRTFKDIIARDSCAPEPPESIATMMKEAYQCKLGTLIEYVKDAAIKSGKYIDSWTHVKTQSSDNMFVCDDVAMKQRGLKAPPVSVAIKEISSVMWAPKLKWLSENVGAPLKILWLVRDLRGWVSAWTYSSNSEANLYKSWGINERDLWEPYETCGIVHSGKLFTSKEIATLSAHLKNKAAKPHLRMAAWWVVETRIEKYYLSQLPPTSYMLIQYEHLASYPINVVQEMYHFLGMSSVPEGLMRWVLNNTLAGDDSQRYGTSRRSELMANIWRGRLSPTEIKEMEELGGKDFEFFGYRKMSTEDD